MSTSREPRRQFLVRAIAAPGALLTFAACSGSTTGGSLSDAPIARPDTAKDSKTSSIVDGAGRTVSPGDTKAAAVSDAGPPSVDAQEACRATSEDLLGPYYVEDTAETRTIAPVDEPGERLRLEGRVLTLDCETPLAGAVVELWQADKEGNYHEDKLRGFVTCGAEGTYSFDTIVPGRYLQSTGWRPAHFHLRVVAEGHETLVTQTYFEGDPYLSPNDSCGVCASGDPVRILSVTPDARGQDVATLDIVLAPA